MNSDFTKICKQYVVLVVLWIECMHMYSQTCILQPPLELTETVAVTGSWHTKVIWAMTWQNQQSDCAPSEDSDQPGHPPSLIRVFAVRMKEAWVLSYLLSAQRSLWSDLADAQADLILRRVHSHFDGFITSWLIFYCGLPKLQDCLFKLEELWLWNKILKETQLLY